ncbi:MAG: YihY/virulence factor BrkB family protein [Planctomycetota bacterium]|nr:YihY/virulence factor BrkB family protein [Planctomycetota bacterium]
MSDKSAERGTKVLFRALKAKAAKDDVRLRAAGLAYSSLASLVPVFAIILAVLSGPAFEESRDKVLDQLTAALVPDDAAGGQWTIDPDSPQERFKESFRETIKPLAEKLGAVSVFGFLVLVAAVILLFQAAEKSFNAIWQVRSARPFFLRVAIATSMIFWGPVMLAASVSVGQALSGLPVVGTYFVPALFTTALFTAFFMVMPHAKVRLASALAGGVATALCWEIAKLLFLIYVTHVVSYHKVYGSLGLIPMLFLWVYINWLLILYGAELAYCLQHRQVIVEEWLAAQRQVAGGAEKGTDMLVPPAVSLAAAIEAARRFRDPSAGGVRVSQLAQALHVETGLAELAADQLVAGGILARVAASNSDGATESDDPAYLPACEPRSCNVSALLKASYDELTPLGRGAALDRTRALLTAVSASNKSRFGGLTLADLADETPLPLHVSAPAGGEAAASAPSK